MRENGATETLAGQSERYVQHNSVHTKKHEKDVRQIEASETVMEQATLFGSVCTFSWSCWNLMTSCVLCCWVVPHHMETFMGNIKNTPLWGVFRVMSPHVVLQMKMQYKIIDSLSFIVVNDLLEIVLLWVSSVMFTACWRSFCSGCRQCFHIV